MDTKTEIISECRDLAQGTRLHDRYEINETLGSGGFGITYKAWDPVLKIVVAIKEYFPSSMVHRISGEVVCFNNEKAFIRGKDKFLSEARVLASLNFQHKVKVYDHFYENGTSYIVMEYINGVTLKKYVEANGPMAEEEIIQKFIPLMKDLDKLHKNNQFHRDISPDNIMMDAETEELVLIDFGSAKDMNMSQGGDVSKSVSQSVVKMNYSPLEMFSSAPKGAQADIYSLCATMYWCLTGEAPQASVDRAYDDRLSLPKKQMGKLGKAILKGMSIKIENRYGSVEPMIAELTKKNEQARILKIVAAACAVVVVVAAIAFAVPKLTARSEKPEPAPETDVSQEPEPTPEAVSEEPAEIENRETFGEENEAMNAAIAEAEEQFGGPVSVIKIEAVSDDVSVSDYNSALERMRARAEDITGGQFSIWQDDDGSYVMLPNSLLGEDDPTQRLEEAVWILSAKGGTYFYANGDNYQFLADGDITDVLVEKDDQGQDEICIKLANSAAERVSGLFDSSEELDIKLRIDLDDGGYLTINNLVRDQQNKAEFHCYGDGDMFTDARIDIAQGVVEVIKDGDVGTVLTGEMIPIIRWENVDMVEAPGENQVSKLEEEAIVAKYYKLSSYELENLERVIEEFKKRLDMLNVSYAFGQSEVDPETIFVKVPQSQVPYEALELLNGDEYDISVGTPFWNTTSCEFEKTEDGFIAARSLSYGLENIVSGLADLSSGKAASQEVYLFVGDSKVMAAELTEVPTEESSIVFDRLLMQNEEGTWDGSGFIELISYLQTKDSSWNEIAYFNMSDVEFVNGAPHGYKVLSNREVLDMLEDALKADYPDVSVGYLTSRPSTAGIEFNMKVDENLPAKVLEAGERVYELIKDGCVGGAYVFFIQQESDEDCYARFMADDYSNHNMEMWWFKFQGGRLDQYKDAFDAAYAASGFIKSLTETEEEEPQPEPAAQIEQPQEVQQDEEGYNIFREDTYKIYCPYPEEFAIDYETVGDSTMLMRAYSTENDNYIEVHAKKLDAAMNGSQALEASLKELGGTETYRANGEGWFACSTDKDGAGVYRKGLLKSGRTIMVWFDYHVLDSSGGHTEDINYMEPNFSSGLG